MARFYAMSFASVLFATSTVAQVAPGYTQNPWHVTEETKISPNFDIVDDPPEHASSTKGSVIIAGTELTPSASIGFGMFGERAERPDHNRSTNRDYRLPKSRKAAIGVSLRF